MDSSLRFLLKFGEKDHIEEFASGILYCSNAVTFWGIEDKLKIKGQGDILEAGVKTFAQRMAMQENETGEITVIDMPVNAIAHIDPAKDIPVFCMFAVFDDNCEITSEGSLKIKLPAETKATIREHFPNADSVAVISNPEQFIEDVEKSIGHRMEHECVHYFHIDKGLKIENSDQTAMDMEYMKYLMQDTPPKVEKGKTTYSFAAKYAYCIFRPSESKETVGVSPPSREKQVQVHGRESTGVLFWKEMAKERFAKRSSACHLFRLEFFSFAHGVISIDEDLVGTVLNPVQHSIC